MSTKDRSRLHQFDSKMLPGIFIGLRSESWRKLDRRLDHRRLARHWEQRRVRSSRQKIQVQRKWHQCIAEAFVFPGADGSLRQEGHAQRQTSGHQRAESFDAGVKERVPSTLSEARRDPLQCAKDDSLQQEFAVAVFFLKLIATQRKRGNMSGVRLVNLFIDTMSCPENGRMYRQSQHSQSRWKLTSWDKHKPIRTNLERAVTLKETTFSLKVGSDPRDSASWTSVHHKVYSWVDGRSTKTQVTSRPETIFSEVWSLMSKCVQKKSKQQWEKENTRQKLDVGWGKLTMKSLTPLFRTPDRS